MHHSVSLILILILTANLSVDAVAQPKPAPRPAWTTSRLVGSPDPPPPYVVERVFSKLQFMEPVIITHQADSDRLFVVERAGRIYSFLPTSEPTDPLAEAPVLDVVIDLPIEIENAETIYGLAFDPNFRQNRYCYVCYIIADESPNGTIVSRFQITATEPPRIDPASEKQLVVWKSGGHNGGCLKFGPDGFLYITTGDGGSARPPDGHATGQGVNDLLSCVLRVDVHPEDDSIAYAIPDQNPFANQPDARPEIWAFGFRNPWKMSFDEKSGDLWIGDVGWELYEMIYRVERGGNYGWSVMEGPQPVRGEIEPGPGPIRPPMVSHSHVDAKSITGGQVYRGRRLQQLDGAYIYGDYVTGKIWALRTEANRLTWNEELADSTLAVIAFGRDRQENFYVLDFAGGIYRLSVNLQNNENLDFPHLLSATGLFSSVSQRTPATGVMEFTVAAPQWADHAIASYLVAVPGSESITLTEGSFSFPEGTVLAKTLSLALDRTDPASRRIMETQLLVYQSGEWVAYSYAWNDEQNDAVLVAADGNQQQLTIVDPAAPEGRYEYSWRYHSRAECQTCHNTRHNQLIGFLPSQLNHRRPTASGMTITQLEWLRQSDLIHWSEFEQAASSDTPRPQPSWEDLPSLVNPYDASYDLSARARSYLFTNCAHCHMPGGGGTANFDVRHEVSLSAAKLIGSRPSQGNFLIQDARIVAPNDPLGSVLLYRIAKTGKGRMPHIGAQLVDPAGVTLLQNWILQMDPPEDTGRLRAQRHKQQQQSSLLVRHSTDVVTRQQLADTLLDDTSGALALSLAIQQNPLDADFIAELVKDRELHIRDLFERYLSEDQKTERLGEIVNPDQILRLQGNVERGQQLFTQSVTVQCRNCHRLAGVGKQVGPDLADIGARLKKDKILESMLEPSRTIDPLFSSYVVETVDGRILTGLIKSRTDKQVVLVTLDAREVVLPLDQVELLVRQPKSLMPDLLLRDMTVEQVADLLAFLVNQRRATDRP